MDVTIHATLTTALEGSDPVVPGNSQALGPALGAVGIRVAIVVVVAPH
jgi:hypothetical protein